MLLRYIDTKSIVCGGLAIALALTLPAPAKAGIAEDKCRTQNEYLKLDSPLPGLALRLKGHEELRILAAGSSSTQGHGASKPELAYPAQLQKDLERRYPQLPVAVNNIGVGGTVARDAVDQFRLQLPAWGPHLVIWQVGANDAMRKVPIREFEAALDAGLNMLNEAGVETVLMPPQYAPMVEQANNVDEYLVAINTAAVLHNVAVFRRYEITKALDGGKGLMKDYLIEDGLHHNDLGYHCLALQLGAALVGDY
ncbi:SGNH/GDSL hydrolase family protein [Oceanibaculum pacificum]|uniref:Uncharacterized protein n=1 Tax=Oceanibaculum pacificum TaxID=580166 RepID=A0A154WET3_9PROT|nr:SGNH/GDSL hydrolase family protein [Oceanibaculum pacificum]KZD12020.1 hypothetical protein AUP43_17660 [Oceanibaculum pacificum]